MPFRRAVMAGPRAEPGAVETRPAVGVGTHGDPRGHGPLLSGTRVSRVRPAHVGALRAGGFASSSERSRGEGNGSPLQCPCLENPMDRGAWWAAGHRARPSDFTFTFHFHALSRKWQPTPVFLPGESQGRRSLVRCRLWGRTESDTTEAT